MCGDSCCQSGQDRCGGASHDACGGEGACDCGCGGHGHHAFRRRYQTKADQIAELEAYLAELKTEVQAVEEHLADLRK
jgi:hypothetical protein